MNRPGNDFSHLVHDLKGESCQLWVLNRGDLNFCVHSTPLLGLDLVILTCLQRLTGKSWCHLNNSKTETQVDAVVAAANASCGTDRTSVTVGPEKLEKSSFKNTES